MNQILTNLSFEDLSFPSPSMALTEPNGLLAVGGDLSPQRLINAYTQGIFPWFSDGDPLLWWSPNPRAIINIDDLIINRSLKKFLRKSPYTVTINKCFARVINICADAPFRSEDTWIVDDMLNAYIELHKLGSAHSIEVWQEGELCGGLYGVSLGKIFCGESMFASTRDASKIGFHALQLQLAKWGFSLIDCQIMNPHLESLGVADIPRSQFLNVLLDNAAWPTRRGLWCFDQA